MSLSEEDVQPQVKSSSVSIVPGTRILIKYLGLWLMDTLEGNDIFQLGSQMKIKV
jgi:hypothetical protein